jgi:putative transcriptional regulator
MKSNGSKSITKPKPKLVAFDADQLLESLRGHVAHLEGKKKLTLRTRTLNLPKPVKPFKPREIAAIRADLRLSQPVFAQVLNVPVATARSWETGRRKPTGAALRLLQIVSRSPRVIFT